MADQARVVLGMLPPLLGGIVRRLLAAAPGVSVVGEARDAAGLARAIHLHRPTAVVVQAEDDALPAELCRLLCEVADLAVIGISRDHSRATLFVLRRDRIHDLGPRDLVSAVLASARDEGAPAPRAAPA
jgi:DNA-binding NarL/FixJ family response regulator